MAAPAAPALACQLAHLLDLCLVHGAAVFGAAEDTERLVLALARGGGCLPALDAACRAHAAAARTPVPRLDNALRTVAQFASVPPEQLAAAVPVGVPLLHLSRLDRTDAAHGYGGGVAADASKLLARAPAGVARLVAAATRDTHLLDRLVGALDQALMAPP